MHADEHEQIATGNRQPGDAIRELNDRLRNSGRGGDIVMTAGISSLPAEAITAIMLAIAAFDEFGPDNDPYGEHDFGSLTVGTYRVFWKIDYYDLALVGHSPNAANPAQTRRVMTIMLAGEY
jgi:hypothetical protein